MSGKQIIARFIILALFAVGDLFVIHAPVVGAQTSPATVPAQRPTQGPVLRALQGRGVQVYRCDASAATPAWVLDHPDADLLDGLGEVAGHHDAGPAWHLLDGSTVKGEVVEKTAAHEAGAVPWLVVRATGHQGSGLLAGVETIRRTETHGGTAPAQRCDSEREGRTIRVPYTATYTFYGKP